MNDQVKGCLFVFLGACSFGILSTIVKTAYGEGYALGEITGIQAILGFILLWILYAIQRFSLNKKKAHIQKKKNFQKTPAWKVVLAGISTGSVSLLYYQCVKFTPASVAIILLMQYVWISILLEAIIYRKKPNAIQIISVVIVLVGTILAGGLLSENVIFNIRGIGFGLLAALAYAIFILVNGRIGNDMLPTQKSALMLTGSCALILVIFPPTYLLNMEFLTGLLKWGIPLALFGTVIPPLFFAYGIPRSGVTLAAILSTVELPVAVLSSHFILQEEVDLIRWVGIGIILIAIILPNIRK